MPHTRWPRRIVGTLFWSALLALALAGGLAGGAHSAPPWAPPAPDAPDVVTRPHVILIVVDAVRADHTSAYGYGRATTPNLDALLAEAGVTFADATSGSAWTYPSNAAMHTGQAPSDLGVDWNDAESALPPTATLLAEHLHAAGYYAAGFNTAKFAGAAFGFDRGFDHFTETLGTGATHLRAEELNAIATDWLVNTWTPTLSGTQPLFLYLYYFDPHTWYIPPPPYDTRYDAAYTGTLTPEVYQDGVDVAAGVVSPTARDIEHLVALYDGEIAYWDHHLGAMLGTLDGLGLLEDSLVVLTSDHGQTFGEHGTWTHRHSLYEEVLRVPLLMRQTGTLSAGLVVTTPVQIWDLAPSILEGVGLPVPDGLHGMSLWPLLTGTAEVTSPLVTRDIFSELDRDRLWATDPIAPPHPLRAVRRADWKYIHHVGVWPHDELYAVAPATPYERENVRSERATLASALYTALFAQFDMPAPHIPMTLTKRAHPNAGVRGRDHLTFTLALTAPRGVPLQLWDPLPATVDLVAGTLTGTLDAVYSPTRRAIAWAGALPTDTAASVRYRVVPNAGGGSLMLAPTLINTAWLTDVVGERSVSDRAVVNGPRLYLPVMLRQR